MQTRHIYGPAETMEPLVWDDPTRTGSSDAVCTSVVSMGGGILYKRHKCLTKPTVG